MARVTRASTKREQASASASVDPEPIAKAPAKAAPKRKKEAVSKGEPTSKRTKVDSTPEQEDVVEVKTPAKRAPTKSTKKPTTTKGRAARPTRSTVEPEAVEETEEATTHLDEPEKPKTGRNGRKAATPAPEEVSKPAAAKRKTRGKTAEPVEPVEEQEEPSAPEEVSKPAAVKRKTRGKTAEPIEPVEEQEEPSALEEESKPVAVKRKARGKAAEPTKTIKEQTVSVSEELPTATPARPNRRGKKAAAVEESHAEQEEVVVEKTTARSKRQPTTRGTKATPSPRKSSTVEAEDAEVEQPTESAPIEEAEQAETVSPKKGRKAATGKKAPKTPGRAAPSRQSGRNKASASQPDVEVEAEIHLAQDTPPTVEPSDKVETTSEQGTSEPHVSTLETTASGKRKLEETIEENSPIEESPKRSKKESSVDVADAKPTPAKRGRGRATRGSTARGAARGGRNKSTKKESSPVAEPSRTEDDMEGVEITATTEEEPERADSSTPRRQKKATKEVSSPIAKPSEMAQSETTHPAEDANVTAESAVVPATSIVEASAKTEDDMEGVETTATTEDEPERADSSTLRPEEDYDEIKDSGMETESAEANQNVEKTSTPEAEAAQETVTEKKEKSATPKPESARVSVFLTPSSTHQEASTATDVEPASEPAPVPGQGESATVDDVESKTDSSLQPTVVPEEEEQSAASVEVNEPEKAILEPVETLNGNAAASAKNITPEPVEASMEDATASAEKEGQREEVVSAAQADGVGPESERTNEETVKAAVLGATEVAVPSDGSNQNTAGVTSAVQSTVEKEVVETSVTEEVVTVQKDSELRETAEADGAGDVTAQTAADTSGEDEPFFSPRKRILSPDVLDGSLITSVTGEDSVVGDNSSVLEPQEVEEREGSAIDSQNASQNGDSTVEVTVTEEENREAVKTTTTSEIEDITTITTTSSVHVTSTETEEITTTHADGSVENQTWVEHDSIVLSEFNETTVVHDDSDEELRPIGSSTPLPTKRVAQLKGMSPVRNGDVSDSSFEISDLHGGLSSKEERQAFGLGSSSPQKEEDHSFNLDAAKAAEEPRTPPHGSPNQSHLSTMSDISPLRGDLDETMYFGKSSVGVHNDSRYSPSLSSPPRAESEFFRYSRPKTERVDSNDAGLEADVSNADSSTLDSSMLSPDAAEGAIRIPLDEITLPSQLSPTPSAHTMQPLGAPSNGSKSATTPASSTSTSTAPAPVAPRRTGLRAPSRLGTMNTSHLPAPRRIPISTTTSALHQQRKAAAELNSKTRKHTELNIVAGRVAPITIEEKYIPHPKSPSPTPEERSYQAAIDRRRRKRIEAERGVTLGAGDESDFSPGRDMSGRKIKFLPKLEKREVPKLPLGSKQPEKGILKPLRKRLDNFGNLQDVDDLELSPPQPVTVLKVVYADEREERRGRDELEDIEEEDEWVEDDSISA